MEAYSMLIDQTERYSIGYRVTKCVTICAHTHIPDSFVVFFLNCSKSNSLLECADLYLSVPSTIYSSLKTTLLGTICVT